MALLDEKFWRVVYKFCPIKSIENKYNKNLNSTSA